MYRRAPPTAKARTAAISLALIGHVALLALFLGGRAPRPAAEPASWVTLWLNFPAPAVPEERPVEPEKPAPTPMRVPRPASAAVVEPANESVPQADEPRTDERRPDTPRAPVDWNNQLSIVAGEHARKPTAPDTFSAPPVALKPACKKRESSMEWKGEQDRRVGLAGGIFPYVRLGQCVIGLGFFGCPVGKAEPNTHLLDDMKRPDYTGESVPDPDECG